MKSKTKSTKHRAKLAKAIADVPYYTAKSSTQADYIKRIETLLKKWKV